MAINEEHRQRRVAGALPATTLATTRAARRRIPAADGVVHGGA